MKLVTNIAAAAADLRAMVVLLLNWFNSAHDPLSNSYAIACIHLIHIGYSSQHALLGADL
jgi:hypothetical protein